MSGSDAVIVGADVMDDVDATFPPRLCHLKIWSDFDGYGFDLHVNEQTRVNYVGKIEPGSPAEAAGLREGDRVIEVNGVNVVDAPHDGVFARIKALDGRVSLLVLDPAADQHFRHRDVTVDARMKHVIHVTCPDVNPATAAVATATDSVDAEPSTTHRARLCVLRSWPDDGGGGGGGGGGGYGFTVLTSSESSDVFVGGVDAGSPADVAGLRPGDRIVEVNGVNIERHSHDAVATLINFDPDTVSLLVVDRDADDYFRQRDVVVSGDMDGQYVERIACPTTKPQAKVAARGPRLCRLRAWDDRCGYGFYMEQVRDGRPGHFVGRVEVASPADAAGLRVGDRVVEVDGDNVDALSHQDVVDKVASSGDQHVTLLVVDPATDRFFSEQNVVVTASMDGVETTTCPDTNPAAFTEIVNDVDAGDGNNKTREAVQETSKPAIGYVKMVETDAKPTEKIDKDTASTVDGTATKEAGNSQVTKQAVDDEEATEEAGNSGNLEVTEQTVDVTATEDAGNSETTSQTVDVTANDEAGNSEETEQTVDEATTEEAGNSVTTSAAAGASTVEFAATADEARRRMSKKKDVRSSSMSMKDKYDIFKKM